MAVQVKITNSSEIRLDYDQMITQTRNIGAFTMSDSDSVTCFCLADKEWFPSMGESFILFTTDSSNVTFYSNDDLAVEMISCDFGWFQRTFESDTIHSAIWAQVFDFIDVCAIRYMTSLSECHSTEKLCARITGFNSGRHHFSLVEEVKQFNNDINDYLQRSTVVKESKEIDIIRSELEARSRNIINTSEDWFKIESSELADILHGLQCSLNDLNISALINCAVIWRKVYSGNTSLLHKLLVAEINVIYYK